MDQDKRGNSKRMDEKQLVLVPAQTKKLMLQEQKIPATPLCAHYQSFDTTNVDLRV